MQTLTKRGETLPNGAVVIDSKPGYDGESQVVLCLWTEDWQMTPPIPRICDPYVTWIATTEPNGLVITRSGHYFDVLSDAVIDFNSRI